MGIPPQLFFNDQGNAGGLDASLFQDAPQQPAPSQVQQPNPAVQGLQQAQQQPIPGGPVKQGLGGVLLHIFRNVMVGGVPMAAYPGDLMQNAEQRTQAGLANTRAGTNLANAETANQTAEANARNAATQPRALIDPETGSYMRDENGQFLLGTAASQASIDERYRISGGYETLDAPTAFALGHPEWQGRTIARNAIKTLAEAQNSKSIDTVIGKMLDFDLSHGIDPNQDQELQHTADFKQHLMSFTPEGQKAQYLQLAQQNILAKQGKAQPLTDQQQAQMKAFEQMTALTPVARVNAEAPQRQDARLDRSYTLNVGQLDNLQKPVDDIAQRIGRLNDTLAQGTPQADAVVAPELLSVMAGGAGSGLRMNEAEISRIVGGRSEWESLQAAINQWKTDPNAANSITPAQRKQIQDLVSAVNNKLQAKQKVLNDAQQSLINATDPTEHRRIVAGVRQQLSAIDAGMNAGAGNFSVSVGGKTYTFKDQQSLDGFKREAGIP